MRTANNAKFVSADVSVLAESNERLGLNHLFTRWQFVPDSNETDNKAFAFMLAHSASNNSFNYIVDCGDMKPEEFVAQLKKLGGVVPFTKYTFSISELTSGKHTAVNNGVRTYSTFAQIYLGDDNAANADDAFRQCSDRLFKNTNDGVYVWGQLKSENDDDNGKKSSTLI